MSRPLITDRVRPHVRLLVAVGVAIALSMALTVAHGSSTPFDNWVFTKAYQHLGPQFGAERRWWLVFSEPGVSFVMPAVVLVIAVVRRDVRFAVLAVVAPLLALGVAELLGKPLIGRDFGPPGVYHGILDVNGSYPSGHETAAVSWLTLVVLLAMRLGASRRLVWVVGVLATVWAACAGFGLTVNYYHYATDTIGAFTLTVAEVLLVARATDAVTDRVERRRRSAVNSPDVRDRTRTSRGA